MKKILILILAVILALSLCSCFGDDAPETSGGQNGESGGEVGGESGGNPPTDAAGSVSQAAMEQRVASLLSAIGGPSSISLCDGEISYTPGSDWGMAGDMWTIKSPTVVRSALAESLKSQLESKGFYEKLSLFGTVYALHAGVEDIGLTLFYGEDDESEITILMTHASEDYSQSYISAREGEMPAIIAGDNAVNAFPDTFKISWEVTDTVYTLSRRDGKDWYYGYVIAADEDSDEFTFSMAALAQSDGSYKYYEWSNYEPDGYEDEIESFSSYGGDIEGLLSSVLDYDGMAGPGPSTWLQMSKDYENNTTSAYMRRTINSSMKVTGNENIGGVECQVISYEGWGQTTEYAVDASTGVLFRFGETDYDGNMEYSYTVTDYSTSTDVFSVFN